MKLEKIDRKLINIITSEMLSLGVEDIIYLPNHNSTKVLFHRLSIFLFYRAYDAYMIYCSNNIKLNLLKSLYLSKGEFQGIDSSSFKGYKYFLSIKDYDVLKDFINITKDNNNYLSMLNL